jgi:hypothetical protein
MTVSSYPVPPTDNPDEDRHRRQIVQAIELLMHGKSNNVLDVTLTANAAATTVSDARIGVTTFPSPVAVTANAAAIDPPYVVDSNRVNGSFILVHANDSNADKTFKLYLLG